MERLTIIKVGGKVVEEKDTLEQLLNNISKIGGHKLLVHGGGRSATAIAARLGIETQMVDGRRITDQAMLEVVTMVYGGLVNKNIVAGLQARNINAIGLTGADLNIIEAVKRPVRDIDYGFVGDIVRVNTNELRTLISAGAVPVVAPLTHNNQGQMLNTNADTIASELAVGLSRFFDVNLYYCFEKKGVLENPEDDNSVIPVLHYKQFKELQETGQINSGMIPKLDNGYQAIVKGVKQVLITNPDQILSSRGTRLIFEN